MKKLFNHIIIVVCSITLIILTVGIFLLSLTSSGSFYRMELKDNELMENFSWSYYDEKKEDIVAITYSKDQAVDIYKSAIDYIFDKKDDMQIKIDGLEVFSNQALIHMKDVKDIYQKGIILFYIFLSLFFLSLIYIIIKFKDLKNILFKDTIITLAVVVVILGITAGFIFFNFEKAFDLFHEILFPDPQKLSDAYFSHISNYEELPHINNLLLISVLNSNLFMDAGIITAIGTIIVYALWTLAIFLLTKTNIFKKQ